MPRWDRGSAVSGTSKRATAGAVKDVSREKGRSATTPNTSAAPQKRQSRIATKTVNSADGAQPGAAEDSNANRKSTDPVNPSHYQGDYVMRIIEDFDLGVCVAMAVKHLLRAGKKAGNPEKQDISKAIWYLNRRIRQLSEAK